MLVNSNQPNARALNSTLYHSNQKRVANVSLVEVHPAAEPDLAG